MRVVFHIGYSRTGSTYLQTNVFPVHKEINYLGPKNYKNSNNVKITQDELDEIAEDLTKFKTKKEYYINLFDKQKINVFSSEKYTLAPGTIIEQKNFEHLKFIENILKEKYPNVQFDFLVILRDQYDLVKSFYFHAYPVISKVLKIKDFKKLMSLFDKNLQFSDKNLPVHIKFFNALDFNKLYSRINLVFPDSNIKFLFFEDFISNPDKYSEKFADFLNLDKEYTKSLFNSDQKINAGNILGQKIKFISPMRYYLSSSFFRHIKYFLPRFLKDIILRYSISNTTISKEEDNYYRSKVKEYYKISNTEFFEKIKLNNRYD